MRVKRGARFTTGEIDRHRQPVQPRAPERRLAGRRVQPAALSARAVRRHRAADDRPAAACGCTTSTGTAADVADRGRDRRVGTSAGGRRCVRSGERQPARNRRLGLYDLGYQVLTSDGVARARIRRMRARTSVRSSGRRSGGAAARLRPGSGIPFYGQRSTRFLYIVTNTFRGRRRVHRILGYGGAAAGRLHAAGLGGRHSRATRRPRTATCAVTILPPDPVVAAPQPGNPR